MLSKSQGPLVDFYRKTWNHEYNCYKENNKKCTQPPWAVCTLPMPKSIAEEKAGWGMFKVCLATLAKPVKYCEITTARINTKINQYILHKNRLSSTRCWWRRMRVNVSARQWSQTESQGKKIKMLKWPSRSCELNPTEKLWKELNLRVHRRYPQNHQDLKTSGLIALHVWIGWFVICCTCKLTQLWHYKGLGMFPNVTMWQQASHVEQVRLIERLLGTA